MRIAIAGILNKPIRADALGGTEVFTYNLIEGLVKRGHDVTLFGSSDSQTSATLVSICSSKDIFGVAEDGIELRIPYQLLQSENIASRSSEFDIIHNNYFDSFLFAPFTPWITPPVVTTVHNIFFQFPHMHSILTNMQFGEKNRFVFVSKSGQQLAGTVPNATYIYNGIDTKAYAYNSENISTDVMWLGRINPRKGVKDAVQAARIGNFSLIMHGYYPVKEAYIQYFEKEVKPFLSDTIRFDESGDLNYKIASYKAAKVLLFTSVWEEPFGLVMTESMSCGTPVIAYAKGAASEIIVDGETGFLVNASDDDIRGDFLTKKTGPEGLAEAVAKIDSLSQDEYVGMRQKSRKRVEEYFSIETMVDTYEKLYQSLVSK